MREKNIVRENIVKMEDKEREVRGKKEEKSYREMTKKLWKRKISDRKREKIAERDEIESNNKIED